MRPPDATEQQEAARLQAGEARLRALFAALPDLGLAGFLQKPFRPDDVLGRARAALAERDSR